MQGLPFLCLDVAAQRRVRNKGCTLVLGIWADVVVACPRAVVALDHFSWAKVLAGLGPRCGRAVIPVNLGEGATAGIL